MHQILALPLRLIARLFRSAGALVGAFAMLYAVFFIFEGDRSMSASEKLSSQIAESQARLEQITAEREAIERKVVALRPGTIDGDLLDEEAREALGYVKPGEVVILGR